MVYLFQPSAVTVENTQRAFLAGPLVKTFQPIYAPKNYHSVDGQNTGGNQGRSTTSLITQRCAFCVTCKRVLVHEEGLRCATELCVLQLLIAFAQKQAKSLQGLKITCTGALKHARHMRSIV